MDKVRLLPSGVQGLVPTEAALSSFTMSRSPIVLTICSHVWSWKRGTSLKFLHWFVIFCGPADSWTWTRTSGIRNNNNKLYSIFETYIITKALCFEIFFGLKL
ncbi:hypothetical protein AVEN_69451-1 [Araneus ventricosus]|uniref:Uncharacterized protein n=1 Tax=Araneus ventricosus TaxID=182803 RepID=A0A4Y2QHQ7_ARAVE|nr:hypothetical protein AVEN_69451-1 [Araneus ventricosus]